MSRRLACLDVPDFPLQVFLFGRPEWAGEAVVLLDRDEANGRIVGLNQKAAELGLGRGMLYGPCLGIHRHLKAGVSSAAALDEWRARIEDILLRFSPSVERARFREGTWWLDAGGLSAVFPSVRPWLEHLRETVAALGFDCAAAAGRGRFSTYAAALYRPSGPVSLFADDEAERIWFHRAPVGCIPLKAETEKLLVRLKVLTMGRLMEIPLPDIRRRLDGGLADMAAFIRDDERLPLQSINPPESAEWRFPLEDPLIDASSLEYAAGRLLERCRVHARRAGLFVHSVRFILEGTGMSRTLLVRPSRPTRDGDTLRRLFALRLEQEGLDNPVRELRCRGAFTAVTAPQGFLFDGEHRRLRAEAQKALAAIQAERGPDRVQYARILDHPLPMRRFALESWPGFPRRAPGNAPAAGGAPLARRIVLNPRPLEGRARTLSRVAYSGGWWDRPYAYEMAYAESRGVTCWLSTEAGEPAASSGSNWNLIGWLD